jgi:hypothetical protein
MKKLFIYISFAAFITSLPVHATTIDFEAQGGSAPPAFNNTLNSPLTIGIAAFRGGQLLKNEAGSADVSAVYATAGGAPYLDPLTITFSQPVAAFSLALTNNAPDTYTVADNLGGSQSLSLNANASRTFSLTDTGITGVTVSSATTAFWDFAIDNVTFSESSSVAPEPVTFVPVGSVLFAGLLLWRRYPSRYRSC